MHSLQESTKEVSPHAHPKLLQIYNKKEDLYLSSGQHMQQKNHLQEMNKPKLKKMKKLQSYCILMLYDNSIRRVLTLCAQNFISVLRSKSRGTFKALQKW